MFSVVMTPLNVLSCLLPHSNFTSGGGFFSDTLGICHASSLLIFGVTSPWAEAKSSKNSCIETVIALVPVYSRLPPGFQGFLLRSTWTDCEILYSVGLNMKVSSVSL